MAWQTEHEEVPDNEICHADEFAAAKEALGEAKPILIACDKLEADDANDDDDDEEEDADAGAAFMAAAVGK